MQAKVQSTSCTEAKLKFNFFVQDEVMIHDYEMPRRRIVESQRAKIYTENKYMKGYVTCWKLKNSYQNTLLHCTPRNEFPVKLSIKAISYTVLPG